ncbi:hypothetical protein QJS10_CPA03g02192 [Acorus calamus]|uniref:Uncharacterized protein n=1 Tax=Acorus calamus TaxID=4465 RepID=A0AAV9F719_ACOCL|nr:hypothetical protein QJS10_CPA03g02192 [Acorus calamus]
MALWMESQNWKHNRSWKTQTLSLPPPTLLLVLSIVLLFLSLSAYSGLRSEARRTQYGAHLMMAAVPVLLIFIVRSMVVNHGRFVVRVPPVLPDDQGSIHRAGGSPWGVSAAVVVLLVMVSYQSKFLSKWFGPLWRSY